MSGSERVYPPSFPPVIEVFFKAFIVAEKEGVPEIGVDHLLAALDSPTAEWKPVEQSTGTLCPVPRRGKALSSEAKTAIEAAGAVTRSDLEQLSIGSLRRALLAAKRGRTK